MAPAIEENLIEAALVSLLAAEGVEVAEAGVFTMLGHKICCHEGDQDPEHGTECEEEKLQVAEEPALRELLLLLLGLDLNFLRGRSLHRLEAFDGR